MFLKFQYWIFCCFSGSVDKGVVEVTNCFCVPHKETHDQVEAEITYATDVYDLNRRVNSSESIVGKWKLSRKVTSWILIKNLLF